MNMASIITARWKCVSEAAAIEVEKHLLDFVNAGLVELKITHAATTDTVQGDTND